MSLKISYCTVGIVAALSVGLLQGKDLPASDPENSGAWILIDSVSDEFDGDSLDLNKWNNLGLDGDYYGEWKGRAPSQYNPANVTVKDGFLTIQSKWDPDFEFSDLSLKGVPYGKAAPVTTAAIVSKAKFKYGYMEMRCKAADGPVSSSFWTTGKDGEIDVFEHFGHSPRNPNSAHRYHTSFHDWRKGSKTMGTRIWTNDHRLAFKVADDFHIYGLEWGPEILRIFADGRLIRTIPRREIGDSWIATNEQKIWIDSETFDWEINPDQLEASQFTDRSKFIIDYCRVWQRGKPEANTESLPSLFGNQGFEKGLKYWAGEGKITSDAYVGKTAATLTTNGKIQQTVNVKPNTTYILSAWAKLPGTNMKDAWTNAYLNVGAYGGPRISLTYFKPDYHRKSLEFTTGPDDQKVTVFFTNNPKNNPATVDHFQLIESKSPSR